jgi:hypothetical protein
MMDLGSIRTQALAIRKVMIDLHLQNTIVGPCNMMEQTNHELLIDRCIHTTLYL